jgi:hypothetical protein
MLYSDRYGVGSHIAYIKGYPDKTFKPEKQVTRAEIGSDVCKVYGTEVSKNVTSKFKDVDSNYWLQDN